MRRRSQGSTRGEIDQRKKEIKREKILRASIELFTQSGFDKTCIGDIAKRADVATGTFYNFFRKKEDILLHFLDKEIEKSQKEFERKVESKEEFFDKCELLFTAYTNRILRNKEFAKILFQERILHLGLKESVNEIKWMDSFSQLIDEAKQKNQIKNQLDAHRIAQIIFSISTMHSLYFLSGSIKTRKECVEKIMEAVRIVFYGFSA